jgi:hypothetical protein
MICRAFPILPVSPFLQRAFFLCLRGTGMLVLIVAAPGTQ